MNEITTTKHTFLRFKEGETPDDIDLDERIFKAGETYKCPTYVHKTPPCQGSCPSGHEVRGWLAIARGMDKPPVEGMAWQEYAFQRMVAVNPFPATMGRVCPAPCQDGCNRNEVDDFVGINAVEQYVGDGAKDIAAGKVFVLIFHSVLRIGDDKSVAAVEFFDAGQITLLADGGNDEIAFGFKFRPLFRNRG